MEYIQIKTMQIKTMRIETQRLSLVKTALCDKEGFIKLLQDFNVVRYCFDVPTLEEAELQFQSRLVEWSLASPHWRSFSIFKKTSREFIGITGFKILNSSNTAEVGFLFLPEHQGYGYATEAQRALNIYAYDIGVRHLLANVTEGNSASIRVLKKCGFSFSKETINSVYLGNSWHNNLLYEKF